MIRLDLSLAGLGGARGRRGEAPPPPAPPPVFDPASLFAGPGGDGVQGAWFDPGTAGVLFADVAGTIPVTADGARVARMLDLSGRGHHATNADPASQPVHRTDGTRHWLAFPTGKEFLDFAAAALPNVAPFEMMAGFEIAGAHVYGTLMSGLGGAAGPYLCAHQNDIYHYVGGSNTVVATGDDRLVANRAYVTGLHCGDGRVAATLNGVEVARAPRATGWSVATGGRIGWCGNGSVTTQTRFLGGLAIARALSPAQRADLGQALARRAGIAVPVPTLPVPAAPLPAGAAAVYLGDSTVAAFGGAAAMTDFVATARPEILIAVSADTAAGQRSRWISGVADKTAVGWVVIQIGLNDIKVAGTTTATVVAAIQALVDRVRLDAPQAVVLIAQMTPAYGFWLSAFASTATEIQSRWQAVNAAIAGQGPTPVTGVAGRITAHAAQMDDGTGRLLAAYSIGDVIHPNAAGRQVVAAAWVAGLQAAGVTV